MSANRILITGGAGFVGHHLVEHFLRASDAQIVVLDRLTYASTWDRLRDIDAYDDKRVRCFAADFASPIADGVALEIGEIDYIMHLGAETHVDQSISRPERFVKSNVTGTMQMLEFARKVKPDRFYYFSTDEVFGPAPDGVLYGEGDAHNPTNPYAATKSAGEMLCRAYQNCYGVPVVITRTMNVIGERQHFEKFVPKVIRSVMTGERVLIHADKTRSRAGSRFYIHARNVAHAYDFLLGMSRAGETYHIVGEREVDNLSLALMIAEVAGRELDYELVDFHSGRPGHDLRYALDGSKLASIGWSPPKTFQESLVKTVRWFMDHPRWLGLSDEHLAERAA